MDATEALPEVYGHLRRLAGAYMRGERPGHTLSPTGLVYEVWARMRSTQGPLSEGDHRPRDRASPDAA